jgi:hypothetical protein
MAPFGLSDPGGLSVCALGATSWTSALSFGTLTTVPGDAVAEVRGLLFRDGRPRTDRFADVVPLLPVNLLDQAIDVAVRLASQNDRAVVLTLLAARLPEDDATALLEELHVPPAPPVEPTGLVVDAIEALDASAREREMKQYLAALRETLPDSFAVGRSSGVEFVVNVKAGACLEVVSPSDGPPGRLGMAPPGPPEDDPPPY